MRINPLEREIGRRLPLGSVGMSSTARRNNKKLLRLIYLLTWSSPYLLLRGDMLDDDQPLADAVNSDNDVATRTYPQPVHARLRQSGRENELRF